MAELAGYWGPEALLYSTNGDPARSVPVEIRDAITNELAVLYTDPQRSDVVANPTATDSLGNLQFYAEPGFYNVRIVGASQGFLAKVIGEGTDGGGAGPARYEHVQVVAQAVWTVNHNLGARPAAVSLFSLDYSQAFDEFAVQHMSVNQLLISMDVPTAGRALMM